AGDGCGAGVGLESFSIGEAGPVVAGLGEYPGAGERAEPWEAGDDPGVRVLVKRLGDGLLEVGGGGAGGVELPSRARAWRPIACSTSGSCRIWGARSVSRSRAASASMPRRRPAFLSRARSWVSVSAAPAPGAGAAARMARASGRAMPPRASAKAARKAG